MQLSALTRGLRKAAERLAEASKARVVGEYLRRAGLGSAREIHTFTTPAELEMLLNLAVEVPDNGNILEIGSYVGASTCYLAAGVFGRGGTIYCVDTWQNEGMPDGSRDTFAEFNKNIAPAAEHIRTIRKPSGKLLRDDCPALIDLAFLDGYHSYDTTLLDYQTVSPWMSPRGVIALHDTRFWRGPSKVLGEILYAGQWRLAGQVNNLTWLERAKWEDPISTGDESKDAPHVTVRQD